MGGATISSILSSFQVNFQKAIIRLHDGAPYPGAHCSDRLEEGGRPEDSHSLKPPVLQPPEVPPQLRHQPPDGNAVGQPHRPSDPPLSGVGHALPLLRRRHPGLNTDVTGSHLVLLLP